MAHHGALKAAILAVLAARGPQRSDQVCEALREGTDFTHALGEVPHLSKAVTNALYRLKASQEITWSMADRAYALPEPGAQQQTRSPGRAVTDLPRPSAPQRRCDAPSRIGNPPPPPPAAQTQDDARDTSNEMEPFSPNERIEVEGEDIWPDYHEVVENVDGKHVVTVRQRQLIAIRVDVSLGPDEIAALGPERVAEIMRAAAIVTGLHAELEHWDPDDAEEETEARCICCGSTEPLEETSVSEWAWLNVEDGAGLCFSCFAEGPGKGEADDE